MARENEMPEVDFKKSEDLKTAYMYSKFIEEKNRQRAKYAKKSLFFKRAVMSSCLGLAIGIYAYTILRMKQETFLDDFEEPKRIVKQE